MFIIGPRTYDAAKTAHNRRDFRKARRIWTELARAGDPRAQCKLADMYHNGVGVSQNIATAIVWYRKAAAQGNTEARSWLKMRDEQSLRRVSNEPGNTHLRPVDPAKPTRMPPPKLSSGTGRPAPAPKRPAAPQPASPHQAAPVASHNALPAAAAANIHRIDDARRNRRQTLAAESASQPTPLTIPTSPPHGPTDDEPLVLTDMIAAPAFEPSPPTAPVPPVAAAATATVIDLPAPLEAPLAAQTTLLVPEPVPEAIAPAATQAVSAQIPAPAREELPPEVVAEITGSEVQTAMVPTRNERLRHAKNAYDAKDFETALKEWRCLAEVGVAEAQLQLAMMYDNGTGIDADQVNAIKWYHQAADQNDPRAQYNLAVVHALGNGLPVDFVSAYLWFALAHESGHPEAGAGVTELERHLSPAHLAIARGRIKQWQTARADPS